MNEVFFELMSLTRIANRKKLLYWAMIQNISNFACGVGRTAECAFGFFGHTLSPTSRDRLFNKLTGNDKEGRKENNTLRHKQSALF